MNAENRHFHPKDEHDFERSLNPGYCLHSKWTLPHKPWSCGGMIGYCLHSNTESENTRTLQLSALPRARPVGPPRQTIEHTKRVFAYDLNPRPPSRIFSTLDFAHSENGRVLSVDNIPDIARSESSRVLSVDNIPGLDSH